MTGDRLPVVATCVLCGKRWTDPLAVRPGAEGARCVDAVSCKRRAFGGKR